MEGEAAGPEETPQPQDGGDRPRAEEPSAGGEPSAGEPAAEPASHSGSAPAQATAAARPLPASPAAGPAPVPPVPTPAPPASPTDHSSHSSHTRPPPFNVSSLGDGRELRRRTRATSLLPAAEAPGRRAADGTDVCMPGGGAAEAALASLLAERVGLLERVGQLERGLEDLGAQAKYLSSALQSIQLARVPLP